MNAQTLSSHTRFVPLYHFILFGLLLAGLIGSIINLTESINNHSNLYSASLICLLFICLILTAYFARTFALKAQDRAIRAEESLRYFVLSGSLPDNNLTISQLIALRFAPDDEVISLAKKAVKENLDAKEIKKLIKNCKGDYHRV